MSESIVAKLNRRICAQPQPRELRISTDEWDDLRAEFRGSARYLSGETPSLTDDKRPEDVDFRFRGIPVVIGG